MEHTQQLDLLLQASQRLSGDLSLVQRLSAVLELLHAVDPVLAARMIVLSGDAPWQVAVPDDDSLWLRDLTRALIRDRMPTARIHQQRLCAGWPIVWQDRIYGALEIVVERRPDLAAITPVIEALIPLLASAIHGGDTARPAGADELPPADQQQLDLLATQFEAPMLLQPLLIALLQIAIERATAARGSIHLAETNGHGLHLLSFELPGAANPAAGTALVPSTRAAHLAKIALANGQAMIRQSDSTTQFAAPIVYDGRLLGALTLEGQAIDPGALVFTQRLADTAAPALLRAQFYQQLADARAHLQHVFDELPSGLALTDGDGQILRSNQAWWRLWGVAHESAPTVRQLPWDILPLLLPRLPDPLAFSDLFTSTVEQARTATITLQNPRQDLRLVFIPVQDTLSLPSGYLLAVDDITREREADRLKTEFVSVVSHELRTPLTSILGYTELLLAREFDAVERREFIQTVYTQADHLAKLVDDLLNISRIEAGKIELEPWVLPLPRLVRDLVAQINTEIDVERHRVLLDVPEALPPVYADRERVRQVLTNLITNAIKYSPEGGEIVLQAGVLRHGTATRLLADPRQPAGMPFVPVPESAPPLSAEPAMLIAVRDQGIGIPEHELGRIFDRFYRVDNSNTRRIGGTGLGLAITRALVELQGGRIWAESVPGQGSTFYVTLPIATEMLRSRSRVRG